MQVLTDSGPCILPVCHLRGVFPPSLSQRPSGFLHAQIAFSPWKFNKNAQCSLAKGHELIFLSLPLGENVIISEADMLKKEEEEYAGAS